MDTQTEARLAQVEIKIDQIYISVEKTRKYFFWTMVITIAMVVLPAIGLAVAIPSFLKTFSDTQNIGQDF